MSTNKENVGVVILSMPGTFPDPRKDAIDNEYEAFKNLNSIAEKMGLDKFLLLGVTPDVIERKDNTDHINFGRNSFNCWWEMGNCIAYGEHLLYYAHLLSQGDETEPEFKHLNFLGITCCNGFITYNISDFVKKDGLPVLNDYKTNWKFIDNPKEFEVDKANNVNTFNYKNRYSCRIYMNNDIPHEARGVKCVKLATKNMLEYLKMLSEKYNIKQIITCTDNSTYQEEYGCHKGMNMINSEQIRKVCDAPVFSVLNTVEIPYRTYENTVAKPIGYGLNVKQVNGGFDGDCLPDEFCSRGFAIATKVLLDKIKSLEDDMPKNVKLGLRINI